MGIVVDNRKQNENEEDIYHPAIAGLYALGIGTGQG
jgi:hypothetical protein